ncbi:MAG: TlpA family protein disulfide reductase [Acidobacteria bacterium]|nr:TlpA family protein disulfide reductase [Acidobacteriota bacterium]
MTRILRSLALLLALCALPGAGSELSNRPAPVFRLPDSKGRMVSLADFRGKFLVIEFMSTTCPHCQNFAPVLEGLQSHFKGKVGVVSIASFPDNAAAVAQFVQTYKVNYPVLYDPSNSAAMEYLKPAPPNYGFSIPHVFLVDQAGFIRDDILRSNSNLDLFTTQGFTRMLEGYVGRR